MKFPLFFLFLVIILIGPENERRRFLLKAYDLGMTKGDFVFFTIDMLPLENILGVIYNTL